jgi:protein-tyrosine phosphatase
MSEYFLNWVTDQLAVGHAPMSYEELSSIRDQGVDSIVNLCGEYCDLHQIEKDYGFEVYYLPVQDNQAPSLQEIEKALQWLDEAVYLGKKILIHCTLGIGRTGTFITSYLLRRGFSLKLARKKLAKTRAESTSFNQWRFLRKFGKREGKLTIREPSLEGSRLVNLSPYFEEYEALIQEAEAGFQSFVDLPRCGRETDACCNRFFNLELMEAAYISHFLNKRLTSEDRLAAIRRGLDAQRLACTLLPGGGPTTSVGGPTTSGGGGFQLGVAAAEDQEVCPTSALHLRDYRCPLSVDRKCIAFTYRPMICRVYGMPAVTSFFSNRLTLRLHDLSKRLFFELNGPFPEGSLLFPLTTVVSGKFVQDYFSFITRQGDT